jgi:CheY-like chemotaxis protein
MSTILYVEDEATVRLAMGYQLKGLGELVVATNATEAIRTINDLRSQEKRLDLAIVDLHLPAANGFNPDAGFDILTELEAAFPKTPSIILTIRNDQEAWKLAKKHFSVRFVFTKPAASDALIVAARTCLPDCEWPIFIGELEENQT